ncbi:Acetylxylan esterase precursor [Aquisphaera giovannonii]|uniref:Acetylxylan esterase n=1 Tax=Aquisphaera giovannonii TaxID=406548 RepID=A0A5B9W9X8_9BACT|nr:alpha/beta hydrolase [Aquisphaera giovannonii]QEH37438.1 Acetylxylan esterase precursor [Aquisphaera giovannonii]
MLRPAGLALAFALLPLSLPASAQSPPTYPLWPDAKTGPSPEVGDANHAGDVPTLTAFLAPKEKATGAAMLICPGGGYGFLATDHEGKQVAEWLNSLGISAFMLKYRLAPKYHHPAPLDDARRAIRMIRFRAKEWEVDPGRVGVLGFSAGGHLASTLATHYRDAHEVPGDAINGFTERPDVAVLVYPVISLNTDFAHRGSAVNLLGKDAKPEDLAALSNETQVTDNTPPTFLVHTLADTGVPVENSLAFAAALRKHKVPFELHVFEKGKHGLGMGKGAPDLGVPGEPAFQAWPALCATWLKSRGFLDRK